AETTALGAACLAGLEGGFFDGLAGFAQTWQCAARFEPGMSADQRETGYAGWLDAVARVRSTE
ncbi:MAG: glycerol kinase, partial [Proteobacteria bacterium]|nr:glycerol kinase [Pseudomonadota bacterium]